MLADTKVKARPASSAELTPPTSKRQKLSRAKEREEDAGLNDEQASLLVGGEQQHSRAAAREATSAAGSSTRGQQPTWLQVPPGQASRFQGGASAWQSGPNSIPMPPPHVQQHLLQELQQVLQLKAMAEQSAQVVAECAAKIAELDLLVLNRGWRAETFQQSSGAPSKYYWHLSDNSTSQWNAPAEYVATQPVMGSTFVERLSVGIARLGLKIEEMLLENQKMADRNKLLQEEKKNAAAAAEKRELSALQQFQERLTQAVEKEQALAARVRELEEAETQQAELRLKQAGIIEKQRQQMAAADLEASAAMRDLQSQFARQVAAIQQQADSVASHHKIQLTECQQKLDEVELLVLNKGWKAYWTMCGGEKTKYYWSITKKTSQWAVPPSFADAVPAAAGPAPSGLGHAIKAGIARLQSRAEEMLVEHARLEEDFKGASEAADVAVRSSQYASFQISHVTARVANLVLSVKQLDDMLRRAEAAGAPAAGNRIALSNECQVACDTCDYQTDLVSDCQRQQLAVMR